MEAPRPRLYDPYNHFTSEKVGGACSYLGVIGQKIGGALASVAAPLAPAPLHVQQKLFVHYSLLVCHCFELFMKVG